MTPEILVTEFKDSQDDDTQIDELQLNDCDVPVNCPWGADLPGDTCPNHWC